MRIRRADELPFGGFGGLLERHFIMSPATFGERVADGSVTGLGCCHYLADAGFKPGGATGMHAHSEVDIISLLVRGRLLHRGSMGDGVVVEAGQVQVQRAGAESFRHNEINPDRDYTHLVQLWMIPNQHRGAGDYRIQTLTPGRQRVYGAEHSNEVLLGETDTCVDIIDSNADQQWALNGLAQCYLVRGQVEVSEGERQATLSRETLVEGQDLQIQCQQDSLMVVIQRR